jgi:hypothetical protein
MLVVPEAGIPAASDLIPQVAFFPEKEILVAATSPSQKWVAMERFIPVNRTINPSDMEINFFIK